MADDALKDLRRRMDHKYTDAVDDLCQELDTLMDRAAIAQDDRSELVGKACDRDVQEWYDNWIEEGGQ